MNAKPRAPAEYRGHQAVVGLKIILRLKRLILKKTTAVSIGRVKRGISWPSLHDSHSSIATDKVKSSHQKRPEGKSREITFQQARKSCVPAQGSFPMDVKYPNIKVISAPC